MLYVTIRQAEMKAGKPQAGAPDRRALMLSSHQPPQPPSPLPGPEPLQVANPRPPALHLRRQQHAPILLLCHPGRDCGRLGPAAGGGRLPTCKWVVRGARQQSPALRGAGCLQKQETREEEAEAHLAQPTLQNSAAAPKCSGSNGSTRRFSSSSCSMCLLGRRAWGGRPPRSHQSCLQLESKLAAEGGPACMPASAAARRRACLLLRTPRLPRRAVRRLAALPCWRCAARSRSSRRCM